jgi:hypothetical protein
MALGAAASGVLVPAAVVGVEGHPDRPMVVAVDATAVAAPQRHELAVDGVELGGIGPPDRALDIDRPEALRHLGDREAVAAEGRPGDDPARPAG